MKFECTKGKKIFIKIIIYKRNIHKWSNGKAFNQRIFPVYEFISPFQRTTQRAE